MNAPNSKFPPVTFGLPDEPQDFRFEDASSAVAMATVATQLFSTVSKLREILPGLQLLAALGGDQHMHDALVSIADNVQRDQTRAFEMLEEWCQRDLPEDDDLRPLALGFKEILDRARAEGKRS